MAFISTASSGGSNLSKSAKLDGSVKSTTQIDKSRTENVALDTLVLFNPVGLMSTFATTVVNNPDDPITSVADVLGERLSDLKDNIDQSFSEAGAFISEKFNSAVDSVTSSNAWKFFVSAADSFMNTEVGKVFVKTQATIGTGVTSLLEGVGLFGEGIIDCGSLLFTLSETPWIALYDAGQFVFTGKPGDSLAKAWDDTKAFVSTEYVKGWFDDFYDDNTIGQWMKNESYGFDTTRGIGNAVGYIAGIILTAGAGGAAAGVGGGASAAVGGISSSSVSLALVGGAAATGQGTEKAWNDGAGTGEGLAYGLANGLWEGFQWFTGAKIGTLFKGGTSVASKVAGSAARVGLDTADSASEGFMQPLLKMLYKYDTNASFSDNFSSLFEAEGGWQNVGVQALLGGSLSALGEASGLTKLFSKGSDANTKVKSDVDLKTDAKINTDKAPTANRFKDTDELFDDEVMFRGDDGKLHRFSESESPTLDDINKNDNLDSPGVTDYRNNSDSFAFSNDYKSEINNWRNSLTESQDEALRGYSGGETQFSYREINKYLRGSLVDSEGNVHIMTDWGDEFTLKPNEVIERYGMDVDSLQKKLDDMSKDIEGTITVPLKKDTLLTRGQSEEFLRNLYDIPAGESVVSYLQRNGLDVEDALKNKIGSVYSEKGFVSTSYDSNGFTMKNADGSLPIVIEIDANKGTKFAPLYDITRRESELLLSKNQKFNIKDVVTDENGQIIVKVETTDASVSQMNDVPSFTLKQGENRINEVPLPPRGGENKINEVPLPPRDGNKINGVPLPLSKESMEIMNIIKNREHPFSFFESVISNSKNAKYGVDQHSVINTLKGFRPLRNRKLKQLYSIVDNWVSYLGKQNNIDIKMSPAEIDKFLKSIDVNGVCTYATACNEIMSAFSSNPKAFEEVFGYPMYLPDGSLNDSALLTDLYSYVWIGKLSEKRDWIWRDDATRHVVELDSNNNLKYKSDDSYTAISWADQRYNWLISGFLDEKLSKFNLKTNIQNYNLFDESDWIDNFDSTTGKPSVMSDSEIQNLKFKLGELLGNKKGYADLCVFRKYYNLVSGEKNFLKDAELIFHPLDGGPLISTNNWNEGVAHSMMITGFDPNGEGIIVSSWGNKCLLKWDDLKKINLTIFGSIFDIVPKEGFDAVQ